VVVLEPIGKEQAPVLRNLFELYAYDFSEVVPLELGPNGRFDVSPGEVWWGRDDHFPFFIRWNGKLSGFALVRRGSRVTNAAARTEAGHRSEAGGHPDDRAHPGAGAASNAGEPMDVAEFFVVRGARGNQVGAHAAHALFAAFPGRWEIRVRRSNVSAMKFWSRTLETWLGRPVASEPFIVDGVDWDVLRIDSSRGR